MLLDITAMKFQTLAPIKTGRAELALVLSPLYKQLFVIGGSSEKCCLSSVEAYNIETNTWTSKAPMTSPRTGHCAVSMPDGIYVIGGYDGSEYLSTMEKYDESTDEWESLPPMPTPRAKFTAVCSKDGRFIYVIGGENDPSCKPLKTIERFNLLEFSWEKVGQLKIGRCSHRSLMITA